MPEMLEVSAARPHDTSLGRCGPKFAARSHGMPAAAWEAGQIICDRYRLERLLGEGGMGQVWEAEHIELRSRVALKLLHPARSGNRVTTKLLREARAAAAIRSSHVVQVFDYGVHDGAVPYLAMELLEGETLADRITNLGGPIPIEDTVRIISQVAKALGRAHRQGLAHRDLKPENIFLVSDEDDDGHDRRDGLPRDEHVKVLDFGIAKLCERLAEGVSKQTHIGRLLGTPNYMSPEQAQADGSVDWRTDLWSLALVAFECVTGELAFHGPSLGPLLVSIASGPMPIPSHHAAVPPGFDEWFAATARRDPAERPSSAKELAQSLMGVLTKRSVTLPPWTTLTSPLSIPKLAGPGVIELAPRRKKRKTGTYD